jgi:hypothetical protein
MREPMIFRFGYPCLAAFILATITSIISTRMSRGGAYRAVNVKL